MADGSGAGGGRGGVARGAVRADLGCAMWEFDAPTWEQKVSMSDLWGPSMHLIGAWLEFGVPTMELGAPCLTKFDASLGLGVPMREQKTPSLERRAAMLDLKVPMPGVDAPGTGPEGAWGGWASTPMGGGGRR